jgi:cytochrome P450
MTGHQELLERPLAEIDANDPAILQDPFGYYRRLREEAPVFRDPKTGIVSVSSYALALEVNKRPKLFSNVMGHLLMSGGGAFEPEELAILAKGLPWVDTLLTADPPRQTRYRRVAMNAFPHRRVEAMEPHIARTVHRLIDRFIAEGQVEFKSRFADYLPSILIAEAMGLPESDLEQFHDWLHAGIRNLSGNASPAQRIEGAAKEIELQNYFLAAMADRRANPRDDIISDLVQAAYQDDDGARPLTDPEIYRILQQIFNAGQETTAHSLTYALFQLICHPEQLAAVLADPSLVANLVEETLRHLSPTNNMWRVVVENTVLGGVELKAGEPMLVRYGSANLDPEKFPDGEAFDITRPNAREHIAFGAGIHTCLGAALARKEMNVALPIVLERLKNLRFVDGRNSFRFNPSPILRGVLSLHIAFDPA